MNQRPPEDPFVVHEHDDWVFTLLRDMCLPPHLVMTSAHYLSDVKKKKTTREKVQDFTMSALLYVDFTFPSPIEFKGNFLLTRKLLTANQ